MTSPVSKNNDEVLPVNPSSQIALKVTASLNNFIELQLATFKNITR